MPGSGTIRDGSAEDTSNRYVWETNPPKRPNDRSNSRQDLSQGGTIETTSTSPVFPSRLRCERPTSRATDIPSQLRPPIEANRLRTALSYPAMPGNKAPTLRCRSFHRKTFQDAWHHGTIREPQVHKSHVRACAARNRYSTISSSGGSGTESGTSTNTPRGGRSSWTLAGWPCHPSQIASRPP